MPAMPSIETSTPAQPDIARRYDLIAVVAAMIFPSLATWLYFVALAGHESMQLVYSGVKVLQFAFPLLWIAGFHKRWPKLAWPRARDLVEGLAFGLAVAMSMLLLYQWFSATVAACFKRRRAGPFKSCRNGDQHSLRFAGLALFYSLLHSLLEEYYWRWYCVWRAAKIYRRLDRHRALELGIHGASRNRLSDVLRRCLVVNGDSLVRSCRGRSSLGLALSP